MARPPVPAAAPVAEEVVVEAAPGGADAPADVMGEGEGVEAPVVFATIAKMPDGSFLLIDGDEPEDMMDGGEVDGQPFPGGPELLRALMQKIEGTDEAAAEDSFGKGFRGEEDAAAEGPAMAG